jgi:pimeloyl-ACP methyl ester carboxylesterase
MRTSWGSGRARVGDNDLVLGPVGAPQSTTGVVFCHAQSHTTATMIAPNGGRPNAWALMQAIAAQFPTIVSDQAGDNVANDTGITAVGGCVTFLQGAASPSRAKGGKVLLVGVSMGFALACAWARQNLSAVAGIVGVLPLVDVGDVYTRNWNGLASVVDAAYGGAWAQATHGPAHDPMVFAAELDVPIRLFAASDDPGATLAAANTFAEVAPQGTVTNLGAIGGHDTEAAYPPALTAGLVPWLRQQA